jgi:hypothetical protein
LSIAKRLSQSSVIPDRLGTNHMVYQGLPLAKLKMEENADTGVQV